MIEDPSLHHHLIGELFAGQGTGARMQGQFFPLLFDPETNA
jgi:hypothetical protein